VRFLWTKGISVKIFIKKTFVFTVGSVCSVKRFAVGSRNSLKDVRKSQMMPEVAETTVKRLLCCGFRRTGKAMGQVYQCLWRICREINVLSRFEYHMFYVLYPFVSHLLILLCIIKIRSFSRSTPMVVTNFKPQREEKSLSSLPKTSIYKINIPEKSHRIDGF
jgi:hypothetical protein